MSNPARSLPEQPSLRYLKIEAKRRLQAGEFASLHDAQLAIAREHGASSWPALRWLIEARSAAESHALGQVRWIISRFGGADRPAWVAPGEDELREHFEERFLSTVTAARLVRALSGRAAELRDELVVIDGQPLRVRAQVGGMQVEAAAAEDEPHRLSGFRIYPIGEKVTDARIAAPSSRLQGGPPAAAVEVAEEAFAELGLVGLAVAWGGAGSGGAGGTSAAAMQVIARGWADLDRDELLQPSHRFAAYSITKLITATVLLRLVAEGLVDLDQPANACLRTVRLADDAVTVRDLLSHVGGWTARHRRLRLACPTLPSSLARCWPAAATGASTATATADTRCSASSSRT
jgi:hypothetical protein